MFTVTACVVTITSVVVGCLSYRLRFSLELYWVCWLCTSACFITTYVTGLAFGQALAYSMLSGAMCYLGSLAACEHHKRKFTKTAN